MLVLIPKKIKIEKFLLRKPKLSDSKELFLNYASDIDVAYFTTWKPHKDENETRIFLKKIIELWNLGKEYNFIIEEKNENKPIGLFKILFKQNDIVQVGYALSKNYWGKGYMTKILKFMISFLFNKNNIAEIQAFCDIENIASQKVLIKSGMKFEKILKNYIIHPNISKTEKRDCMLFKIKK
ncbi:MAG: GNAT family protein [Candidatus Microgenomates bacterium]